MLLKTNNSSSRIWLLLYITISVYSNCCYAQTSFVKTFGYTNYSTIKVDSFYCGNSYSGFLFFKFDKNNTVISQSSFKNLTSSYTVCQNIFNVKENGQNFFLLTGYTHNWINNPFLPPPVYYSSYVIKVNENGDTLWSMLFERGEYFSFCIAPDSNYIFTQSAQGALIMKVDRNTGDTLWTKRYNYEIPGYTRMQVFLGGLVNNGDGYTTSGTMIPQNRIKFSLSKLDTAGNLLWNKSYGDTADNKCWGMTMTHDNGYILTGQSAADDMLESYPWTNFMLVRTDANGDTLWCRTYDYDNGYDVPYAIVETIDNGFVVVGTSLKKDSVGNGYYESIMIKVDSMGNLMWANKYGEGVPFDLHNDGNGFLFTDGRIHQTDSNGVDCSSIPITVTMHYPVMTLTDSMPFLDDLPLQNQINALYYFHPPTEYDTVSAYITDYCINTGVEEQTVKQNDLIVYPNPSLNELAISSGQWASNGELTVAVYDVLGKQKLQQNLTVTDGKLNLDVSGLSSGIYFLRVVQKDKVYNAKFVKEKL